MSTLWLDLRFALRLWAKAPVLALAAVLSLGLGLGANITVFTWLRQTVLLPLPGVQAADRLVALDSSGQVQREGVSYPDYLDLRDHNDVLSGLAAGQQVAVALASDGRAQRAWAWYGTWNLLPMLGVRPALGRWFGPEDDRPGAPLVTVLSDACWRTRFGADPSVVGRSLSLGGRPCAVVGVAPRGFLGPVGGLSHDLFLPLEPFLAGGGDPEADPASRATRSLYLLGRLRPGVEPATAQASLRALGARLETQYPDSNRGIRVNLHRLEDAPMGAPGLLAKPLKVLFAGVAFLLLLATTNVANLLLARAVGREREMALRAALGASRGRLLAQALTESALLGLAGSVTGLALAYLGLRLFGLGLPLTHLPIAFRVALDPAAVGFALLLALAVAALAGLPPALRRATPAAGLDSARTGQAPRARRLQAILVALETALAVALLAAAGLMVRSAWEIQRDTPGFQPKGVLAADLGVEMGRYDAAGANRLGRDLLARVRALPGVAAASASEGLPLGLSGAKGAGIRLDRGQAADERLCFNRDVVAPDFCRTLGIPLLAGREFTEADGARAAPVALVNATLARRYYGGAAVGRQVWVNGTCRTIVGVCQDFKFQSWSEPASAFVYLPFAQWDRTGWTLLARVDTPAAAEQVRQAIAAQDPDLPVRFLDLEEVVRHSGFLVRALAVALTALGLTALFLAAVGVYGVLAHAVSQRTPELGVRSALGARPGELLRMVLREGLFMAGAGIALGLAGAHLLALACADLLHNTSPSEPGVFLGVAGLMLAVAALACLIPARRAARVDPMRALRAE